MFLISIYCLFWLIQLELYESCYIQESDPNFELSAAVHGTEGWARWRLCGCWWLFLFWQWARLLYPARVGGSLGGAYYNTKTRSRYVKNQTFYEVFYLIFIFRIRYPLSLSVSVCQYVCISVCQGILVNTFIESLSIVSFLFIFITSRIEAEKKTSIPNDNIFLSHKYFWTTYQF